MFIGSCARRLLVAGACLLWVETGAGAQDSAESTFKAKQISLIVGSSPDGGYDIYARLLARRPPADRGRPLCYVAPYRRGGSASLDRQTVDREAAAVTIMSQAIAEGA